MPFTPQDFVSKWKRVTSREKQTYQEHFIDLCRLADHQTPNEADPTGKRYAFEMGAAKIASWNCTQTPYEQRGYHGGTLRSVPHCWLLFFSCTWKPL